jgi:hypothetical protein
MMKMKDKNPPLPFGPKLFFSKPPGGAIVTANIIDPAVVLQFAIEDGEDSSGWDCWPAACSCRVSHKSNLLPRSLRIGKQRDTLAFFKERRSVVGGSRCGLGGRWRCGCSRLSGGSGSRRCG